MFTYFRRCHKPAILICHSLTSAYCNCQIVDRKKRCQIRAIQINNRLKTRFEIKKNVCIYNIKEFDD